MKRWVPLGVICILLLTIALGLSRPVIDPARFTGKWYSSSDGNLYLFQEGIIQCADHYVLTPEGEKVSGAYTFGSDTIAVFAMGIDGLDMVSQLYLIRGQKGDALCDRPDGSGSVYFYRDQTAALNGGR